MDLRAPQTTPWRSPHRLRLHVDGGSFLPAMLRAIRRARHYILAEMYLVEPGRTAGRFAAALAAAASRSVQVLVLIDDFGSRALSQQDRDRLTGAGIHLAIYNPLRFGAMRGNLERDHRKLLLVDGRMAFVGGAGITDEFNPRHAPHDHWHEFMLRIEGPCVEDWHRLFTAEWRRWSDVRPPAWTDTEWPFPEGACGRIVADAAPGSGGLLRSTLARFKKAERRLWIATAYFVPTRRLRQILGQAARRGVDVRLLLPSEKSDHPAVWHAGRRFYGRLLRQGVRIYEYQPRFLHAKAFLCDDWVSIGSGNLDHWTLRWNLEAAQEIEDAGFSDEVARILENDFAQSETWDFETWQRRGRITRLLERAWGAVDALLVYLSYRGHITQGRRRRSRPRTP